jgi:tetratricopeptide (TPR) repeat protein
MLGVAVDGEWAALLGALRAGWFAAAAGGLALLLGGAPELAGRGRAGWRHRLPLVAALLVVAGLGALVGRGVAAVTLSERGAGLARAGDYRVASSLLTTAGRLDPSLARDEAYELAVGQALLASGRHGDALALLADAELRGETGDAPGQVAELTDAVRRAPGDPVLVEQLRQATWRLALVGDDPRPIRTLGPRTTADEYTEGRVLYDRSAYADALTCFQRVLTLTGQPDVRSSAYTYIALSEAKLGRAGPARRDMVAAVLADTGTNNVQARSLALGLYAAGEPRGRT